MAPRSLLDLAPPLQWHMIAEINERRFYIASSPDFYALRDLGAIWSIKYRGVVFLFTKEGQPIDGTTGDFKRYYLRWSKALG